MRKIKRKAEFLPDNIGEILLTAVIIAIAIAIVVKFITPIFDRPKETVKVYVEALEEELQRVDSAGSGVFGLSKVPVDADVYVINFNGDLAGVFDGHVFNNAKVATNSLAVCYSKKEENSVCEYVLLSHPIRMQDEFGKDVLRDGINKWAFTDGFNYEIKLVGEDYVFKKIV